MESNKIQSALEYWHSRLSQECGEDHILNITLYGSQNYNIDTPYSDVDVKAIYVPCLADAVLENKWTSFEFHNIQNEHCELKDIREMCKMYQKQNLNFLETLFTEYRWDNPKYREINDAFKSRAEDIAHYNMRYGVKSTCGQALNAIKQSRNNPTDLKKFAKVIYLYLYLNKYIDGYDYRTCLRVDESERFSGFVARPLLIGLKSNDLTSFDTHQISKFMKEIDTTLNFLEEFFKNASENVKPTDDETNVWYFLRKTAFGAIMLYDGYSAI